MERRCGPRQPDSVKKPLAANRWPPKGTCWQRTSGDEKKPLAANANGGRRAALTLLARALRDVGAADAAAQAARDAVAAGRRPLALGSRRWAKSAM